MSDKKKIKVLYWVASILLGSLLGLSIRFIELYDLYKTSQTNLEIIKQENINLRLYVEDLEGLYEY